MTRYYFLPEREFYESRSQSSFVVIFMVSYAHTADEKANAWDGVYVMCEDVAGYSGEFLILKNGKFRYWFYSDVGALKEIHYPLTGSFKIDGRKLTLNHEDVYSKERTLDELNGHKVVWRDDGLEYWKEEKSVHPYAVLIRIADDIKDEDLKTLKRPDLKQIKSAEVVALEEKRYRERYNDIPEPARGLYRDQSAEDEVEHAQLQKKFEHYRKNPAPELFKQLVIRAIDPKGDDYAAYFISELIDTGDKKEETLEMLVESMSFTNANGLGSLMTLFIKKTGINSFDMNFPELGVRLAWKLEGNSLHSEDGWIDGAPRSFNWHKEPKQVIAACQKWCRKQLAQKKSKP